MKIKLLSILISSLLANPLLHAKEEKLECKTDGTQAQSCENQDANLSAIYVLPKTSVVGSRTNSQIVVHAGQISVLSEQDIVLNENLIPSLSNIPGFQTGNDFGRNIGAQFKIRGFGYQSENRVIIKQDGVKRSPSLFSNHISSFRIDSNLLKRVEVVKGASSVLHGSGAIGGIVSMTTKDARDFMNVDHGYGITVGARRETNNMHHLRAAFALSPEDAPVDLLVYAKRAKFGEIKLSDGGVTNDENVTTSHIFNDEEANTRFVKAGWDISDEQRVSISAYDFKENLTTVWQTLWHSTYGSLPVVGELRQKDNVLNYEYAPSAQPLINFSAKIFQSDAYYHRVRSGKIGPRSYNIDYENKDERWGLALNNVFLFNTDSLKHQLIVGVDYDNREENAIFNFNGELSDFGSFPNYYRDLGLYAQDTIDIDKFSVTVGARFDKFKRGVDKPGRQSYSESRLSPKISTAYEVTEGIYLLAGYAETFRGPTPNETSPEGPLNPFYWYVANLNLKPETAKEFEVGVSADIDGLFTYDDQLFFKATYFDGKIDDMINLKRAPELGTPPRTEPDDRHIYAQYRNVSNARRKGFELSANYKVGNWHATLGYDHLKMYDEEKNERIDAFADKITLGGGYNYLPWDLGLSVNVKHWLEPKRDDYTLISRGKKYQYIKDKFTIVDIQAKWSPSSTNIAFFDQGFAVTLGVNNVLDKNFINPSRVETTTAVGKATNLYLDVQKTF